MKRKTIRKISFIKWEGMENKQICLVYVSYTKALLSDDVLPQIMSQLSSQLKQGDDKQLEQKSNMF